MRPWSMTMIWSARWMVERRCAMQMVVRPSIKFLERGLHGALGFGVEGTGRFVEDENGRVLHDGARDGEALALAAGKHRAPLADDGVVALRPFR